MPLPVIPGGFRVRSTFSNVEAGRPWSTGMDYFLSGGSGDAQELADQVVLEWAGFFASIVNAAALGARFRDEVRLAQVLVYDLGSSAAPAVATPATSTGGTAVNPALALPPDLAIVVSKRTAFRGARGRGRSYLSGFATGALSQSQPGFIAPEVAAGILEQWQQHFSSITAVGQVYDEVVIGRIATGSPIQAAYPITNYVVDQSWDVQRRRGLA